MKRYIGLISFFTLLYTIPTITIPISRRATEPNFAQTLTTPNFQISISPLEINSNGTKVLDTQGEYYLTNDIDYDPVNNTDDEIIIHITASNVTLNLNSKQINHSPDNPTKNVRGIVVEPNLTNVVIHNGSIHNCSGAGIVVGENCTNISLFKISVINCKLAGIVLGYNPFDTSKYSSVFEAQEKIRFANPATGSNNAVQDVVLSNVYVTGTPGYYSSSAGEEYSHAIGMQLVDVKNFQILHSISNSNEYSAPDAIKNSNANPGGYYVADRSGYNGYGIQCIRCANGHIENCESSGNTGWTAIGFLLEQCKSIKFIYCFAHRNTADGDPLQHETLLPTIFNYLAHRDIGRAAGFLLNDSSGSSFETCSSHFTTGNRESAGFWFRRYLIIASNTEIPNSQLYDPTIIQDQLAFPETAGNVDIGNVLLIPPTPNPIPSIGSGYNVTDGSVYIQHSGSNCNRCVDCHAQHTTSHYLSAHGFLCQGNTNNAFTNIKGENSVSGIGSDVYNLSSGSIYDFDTGVNFWSLTEHEQYLNPHTNKIIQFASGITFECMRIPLFIWNDTTETLELAVWNTVAHQLQAPGSTGNLLFLGTRVQSSPDVYAIPCWSETCPSITDSSLQENYGSCVGSGVGILLNGVYKSFIKKNWLYCNHSCNLGTTSLLCDDNPSGIGALGGYGLLDLYTNSTALIMENLAYANQIVRPKIITSCCDGVSTTGFGQYIEGSNYNVKYSNPSLSLPIEKASIGDFSPFNLLTPFSNFEWECETINAKYTIKDKALVNNIPRVFTL